MIPIENKRKIDTKYGPVEVTVYTSIGGHGGHYSTHVFGRLYQEKERRKLLITEDMNLRTISGGQEYWEEAKRNHKKVLDLLDSGKIKFTYDTEITIKIITCESSKKMDRGVNE